ncbi:MAG: SprT family zinc-dependent metalloprotease [Gammaproteobacteria bacterium]|nr:SprT family zinc-dependent metalloprotease [Gammaproteobacteria bacterium]
MNTENYQLQVADVAVEVVRKNIKNLHIGVYPPEGRVRVAAPIRLGEEAIRLAVVSKLSWIHKRQARFASQPRQSEREFVTGESHYFEGRRYRLDVVEGAKRASARLRNRAFIELRVPPDADRKTREAALYRWYRRELQARLPVLCKEWEPKVGVEVRELRVKRMKTLWGSCNSQARRIWLNLELAKKPPACLAFVLVHEMVHFHERRHNERFYALMDAAMPQWRTYRDELNSAPLAHEDWKY